MRVRVRVRVRVKPPYLPLLRICMATLKPSPGWLSTFSTGIGVFSKYTWNYINK